MRFAYADPPYLGCGRLYKDDHPESMIWNDPETHRNLIVRLCDEYPDGWAMSLSATSMQKILPMCPDDVRVLAWVKNFAAWKKGAFPPYCWEPVIMRGGRKQSLRKDEMPSNYQLPLRDYFECPITLKKGLTGAKPPKFCIWVFCCLGAQAGDSLDDLFPGTGIVSETWNIWMEALNTGDDHD